MMTARATQIILVSLLWFLSVDNVFSQAPVKGRVFSFQTDDQYRLENWTADGTSRGFFGWVDHNGEGIDIEFIADENGYRVIKKKNKLNLLSRNPRDKEDAEEFEFDDEDQDGSSYRFAYNTGTSFREEVKRGGLIYGKYGFITADGKLHVVRYTASKKRGFIPIREVRDASEFAAAYAEPATPVPLRRLRALATPVELWPESNNRLPSTNVTAAAVPPVQQSPKLPVGLPNAIPVTVSPLIRKNTLAVPVRTFPIIPQKIPQFHNTAPSNQVSLSQSTVPITRPWIPASIPTPNRRAPHVHKPQPFSNRAGTNQFSYNLGRLFHRQNETSDGVFGNYGWRDADGVLHVVHYVADNNGYKIIGRDKILESTTKRP